jgi:hypothetical protein
MPSITRVVVFASLATSLAIASPFEKVKKDVDGSFHIDQVQIGTSKKVGAIALQKAYQKYKRPVPTSVAAAAQSGSVSANPEQYDAEYLCQVSVGSTTLNLDFDTGSADL